MIDKLKKVVLFIILLVFVQTISFYIIGRNSITNSYSKKLENSINHNGVLGVLDNNFSEKEKNKISKRLSKRYSSVIFISNRKEYLEKYRLDKNEINYGITYESIFRFPYMAIVTEQIGTLYYGEEWETNLIWCFGWWLQLNRKCIGQS